MVGLRAVALAGLAIAFAVTATPATAVASPVLVESFENCTHDETPGFTDVPIALSNPAAVDLWWDDLTVCGDWEFSGSAWLARHTDGPSFPDGDYALWLNEFPAGSASYHVTGMNAGTTYTISFDAATDNDEHASSIYMFIALVGTMPDWTINLEPEQDWTHYEFTFLADGEDGYLTISGGTATEASPVIDNLCIAADGCTVVDDVAPESTTSALGQTGVDSQTLIIAALAATVTGAVVVRMRKQERR
ncbi:MAG: hypothetical protein ACKOWN_03510 [Microbacteriaceae bacterium]